MRLPMRSEDDTLSSQPGAQSQNTSFYPGLVSSNALAYLDVQGARVLV